MKNEVEPQNLNDSRANIAIAAGGVAFLGAFSYVFFLSLFTGILAIVWGAKTYKPFPRSQIGIFLGAIGLCIGFIKFILVFLAVKQKLSQGS